MASVDWPVGPTCTSFGAAGCSGSQCGVGVGAHGGAPSHYPFLTSALAHCLRAEGVRPHPPQAHLAFAHSADWLLETRPCGNWWEGPRRARVLWLLVACPGLTWPTSANIIMSNIVAIPLPPSPLASRPIHFRAPFCPRCVCVQLSICKSAWSTLLSSSLINLFLPPTTAFHALLSPTSQLSTSCALVCCQI